MIHNKRVPHIDGMRVDEAHKGGGSKGGKGSPIQGFKAFKSASTSDKIGGILTGAWADPLDLSGMRSGELAKQEFEKKEKIEQAKAYKIEAAQKAELAKEQAKENKRLAAISRKRGGRQSLLTGSEEGMKKTLG